MREPPPLLGQWSDSRTPLSHQSIRRRCQGDIDDRAYVGLLGSWLCENAKTLNRNRRSYSSKTVLVAQRASGFNLEIELKNIILRRVSIFEFLHSQGPFATGSCRRQVRPCPLCPESGSEFSALD